MDQAILRTSRTGGDEAEAREADRRLRAWKASGEIRCLWPDATLDQLRAANQQVVGVVQDVLNRSDPRPEITASSQFDAATIGFVAFLAGMGPLIGYWIETGQVVAGGAVVKVFRNHLQHGRLRADILRQQLLNILPRLNDHGIVPTVLKGTVTSRDNFPDPGTRPAADIDLLVRPAELERAGHALREAGLVRRDSEWVPVNGQTEWHAPDTARAVQTIAYDHAHSPWTVDLHTSIDRRYFWGQWARFGDLPWTMTRDWPVAGARAKAFSQPLHTAHLAQHASIDALRLVRLVELVLVIRQDTASGELDWDRLTDLLQETGTTRFAYPALELAGRLAEGLIPADVARRIAAPCPRRQRAAVDGLAERGFQEWGGFSLARKLMWARGPVELALSLLERVWSAELRPANYLRVQRRRMRMLLSRWIRST